MASGWVWARRPPAMLARPFGPVEGSAGQVPDDAHDGQGAVAADLTQALAEDDVPGPADGGSINQWQPAQEAISPASAR